MRQYTFAYLPYGLVDRENALIFISNNISSNVTNTLYRCINSLTTTRANVYLFTIVIPSVEFLRKRYNGLDVKAREIRSNFLNRVERH